MTWIANLTRLLDLAIHPEVKRQSGVALLRSRILNVACFFTIISSLGIILVLSMRANNFWSSFYLLLILFQSLLVLGVHRWVIRSNRLAALHLFCLGILVSSGIAMSVGSLLAPGYLWFPVLIMSNFLLCGRRLAVLVSLSMIAMGMASMSYVKKFGLVLPYENQTELYVRALITTIALINGMTMAVVSIYYFLMQEGEKRNLEQRTWIQRAARMQELSQMSGHFALKTNGPLDVLGTALHNLEDPLGRGQEPRSLLRMLEPVESSIQTLASVSKSFSLFSRRYQEEGLEQTSINAILQHVDTIYNVGSSLLHARMHWKALDPDILIYTQTAKLVMLLTSLARAIAWEGGRQLAVHTTPLTDGIQVDLKFSGGKAKKSSASNMHSGARGEVVFDPELNENLIHELCQELNIQMSRGKEGADGHNYALRFSQASCQSRVA